MCGDPTRIVRKAYRINKGKTVRGGGFRTNKVRRGSLSSQKKKKGGVRTFELSLDRLGELRALDDRVEGLLGRENGVKVGHVHGAAHGRLERRLDLLLSEAPPVDLLEERMAFDLVGAVDAQPLRGVAREQAGQDRSRAWRDLVREEERIAQDLFVHLVGDLWRTT